VVVAGTVGIKHHHVAAAQVAGYADGFPEGYNLHPWTRCSND
jgi:hypothetical protein